MDQPCARMNLNYAVANLDARALVLPLLACLSTASVSPQPPPALLPLLSPILAQRVQLLSDDPGRADSWLRLLCWDDAAARRLSAVVESLSLEPHPVSGEVEFKHEKPVMYRRVDQDTFQAKIVLEEPRLDIVCIWCSGPKEEIPGWRIGELWPRKETNHTDMGWCGTVDLAESAASSHATAEKTTFEQRLGPEARASEPLGEPIDQGEADYWRQYDNLNGADDNESLPDPSSARGTAGHLPATSDDAFYARYNEVQPALDDPNNATWHDRMNDSIPDSKEPTEVLAANVKSDLDPDTVAALKFPYEAAGLMANLPESYVPYQAQLLSPLPQEPPSTNVATKKPEEMEASLLTVQRGVKQFIDRTLQNLQQLAKDAGIGSTEFKKLVQNELEQLRAD